MTPEELVEAIVASVGDPGLRKALSSGWSQLLKARGELGAPDPGHPPFPPL